MVDKIRVVKKIEISAETIKKVQAKKRLEFFWKLVFESIKSKNFKVDVTKVRVSGDLAKLLNKNPWQWLDIGPCINHAIPKKKEKFIVELCSGWNLKNKRKTVHQKFKELLTGESCTQ